MPHLGAISSSVGAALRRHLGVAFALGRSSRGGLPRPAAKSRPIEVQHCDVASASRSGPPRKAGPTNRLRTGHPLLVLRLLPISRNTTNFPIACDDPKIARRVASEPRAFKVAINAVCSRGDREEVFGGIGQSWKRCFVGGRCLVLAVTSGPVGEKIFGKLPDYTQLPEEASPNAFATVG